MKYGSWANWSPCSATCGTGSNMRHRECLLETGCESAASSDRKECGTQFCPSTIISFSCMFSAEQ